MKRRIVTGLGIGLCLLILGFAGLLIYRTTVAQWFLSTELTARGFKFTDLEVTALGLGEAKISGITAGRARELQVDEVTLTYRWPDLFAGQFAGVSVDGLTLALDLTGEGPPLGSLDEVFGPLLTEREQAGPPDVLPNVEVRNARVLARTRIGPVALAADGLIGPIANEGTPGSFKFAVSAEEGQISGQLDFIRDSGGRINGKLALEPGRLAWSPVGLELVLSGGLVDFLANIEAVERVDGELALDALRLEDRDFGAGALALSYSGEAFSLKGNYGDAQAASGIELSLEAQKLESEPHLNGQIKLGAIADDFPWQLGGLVRPTSGRADLNIHFEGALPPAEALRRAADDPAVLLRRVSLEAEVDLRLSDWALPEQMAGFNADLPMAISLAEGRISAGLDASARLRDAVLLRTLLVEAGLPANLLGKVQELKLTGLAGPKFEIHSDLTQDPPSIQLKGRLDLEAPNHLSSQATGESQIAFRNQTWILGFDGLDLKLSSRDLKGLPLGKTAFDGRLAGEFALDGHSAEHSVTLSLGALDLEIEQEGEAPLPLRGGGGQARFESAGDGHVALDGLNLNLPSVNLRLEDIAAALPLAPETDRRIPFTLGRVLDTTTTPRFAPGKVKGRLNLARDRYSLRAEFLGSDAAGPFVLTGSHSPGNGRGSLVLEPKSVTFAENGPQPADLSPRLKDLKKTEGTADVEARLSWGSNGTRGEVSLALNELSTEAEGKRISGLRLALRLDPLLPLPGSPPAQRLFVEEIQAAVPIDDLTAQFQVLPRDPSAVLIERADFTVLGARLRVTDTVWEPEAEKQTAAIQVLGLDLGALLESLKLDGVKGSGELVGLIPVRLEGNQVVITDAKLSAREPGLLKFKSEAAAGLLSSGGEPVKLLLQALEDFRYEELSLTATKDGEDELELKLRLLGRNPAVLEGRPFKFNINLNGNIGPILKALSEGSAVSADALRRSWRLRQ